MEDLEKNNEESRQYYRINDIADLTYYVLLKEETFSHDEHEKIVAKFLTPKQRQHLQMMQEFSEISIEMAKAVARACGSNTELAKYLELTQRKVDLLARNIFCESDEVLTDVNLSIGGCAFDCAQSLKAHSRLKIRLVLQPSYQAVIVNAVVVRSEKDAECDPKRPYRIFVEFIDLDEKQEFILNRHITNKQLEDIRRSRQK